MLTVVTVEPESKTLKQLLRNNFIQINSNVFAGNLTRSMSTKLISIVQHGDAMVLTPSNACPFGFQIHIYGNASNRFRCFDGVVLTRTA